jgi:hypothetical protein
MEWIELVLQLKCQLLIHVIPIREFSHPLDNNGPSVVMLKRVDTGESIAFSLNREDYPYSLSLSFITELLANLAQNRIKVWCLDKKTVSQLLGVECFYDLNILILTETNSILDIRKHWPIEYIQAHRRYDGYPEYNQIVSISSHVKFMNSVLDDAAKHIPKSIEQWYTIFNTEFISCFSNIEAGGLKVDRNKFEQYFSGKSIKPSVDDMVHSQYNIYTITGRPSNRFGGMNFAALNKEDGSREAIISRYPDGQLVLMDYSAYHPHLIAKLINYSLPADAYRYFGQYYFNTDEVTDEQVKESKKLTFTFLYGTVPDKFSSIPYFKKMLEFIQHRWDYFNRYGYVESALYKRPFYKNNVPDANANKLFNYMLQRAETEYNVDVLNDVFLYTKDRKICPILYTYDSILFDMAADEIANIAELTKIMTKHGFPIKIFSGKDYNSLSRI